MIHKSVSAKTELSSLDLRIITMKYAIRSMAGSKENWYGLDTSTVLREYVPLIILPGGKQEKIQRMEM